VIVSARQANTAKAGARYFGLTVDEHELLHDKFS